MRIDITFGGALTRFLPEGHKGNRLQKHSVTGATLAAVLSDIGIENDQRMLVILNGHVVHNESFVSTQLSEGDQLSLMPPIQAG